MFLLGLVLIGAGIGMIYLPAAVVYAGVVLSTIAALLERNQANQAE